MTIPQSASSSKTSCNGSNGTYTSNPSYTIDDVRRANYAGQIPVQLTLAQTSLCSASVPQPQHILLSRQTFLHLGLEDAVRRLHNYSFTVASSKKIVVQEDSDDDESNQLPEHDIERGVENVNLKTKNKAVKGNEKSDSDEPKPCDDQSAYPVCWFEDIVTQRPLRWQYFAGILFDSLHPPNYRRRQNKYEPHLPWRIRLHFQSYPSHQLLELDNANYYGAASGVLHTIQQTFQNSLKQGLVIQYGNSKAALNLSKQSHAAIWEEAIKKSDYDSIRSILFCEETTTSLGSISNETETVNNSLAAEEVTKNDDDIKQNVAVNDSLQDEETNTGTSNRILTSSISSSLVMIPIRLSLDPTRPMIQKRVNGGTEASFVTLGLLLFQWVPDAFEENLETPAETDIGTTTSTNEIDTDMKRNPNRIVGYRGKPGVHWTIAGISPPLSVSLVDLWRTLRHPDNFLYICITIAEADR